MKKYKYFLICILLINSFSFAQGFVKQKKEQIKALKVGYITDELQLTPEEATKFWPLFNAFEDKQKDLKKGKVKAYLDRMENAEIEKMDDKAASAYLAQMENTEDELYQSRKKFVANLKGILPPIKIIKLKKAEEGFKRKLLKQYRDRDN